MGTGITNSSDDYKGGSMGNTPASDKASKMSDKEPVSGGIRKKSVQVMYSERTDAGRSSKKMPDSVQKNGFDPKSRGF
jgi:hypothetical protein